jgi:hypothetical protein
MSNATIPLRVIASVSGHQDLSQLHAYLEVQPEQVKGAIASLNSLSYIGKFAFPKKSNYFSGIYTFCKTGYKLTQTFKLASQL